MPSTREKESLGRAVWKGHLKLSLVVCPVKAYTAHRQETHLRTIHERCGAPLQQKLVCPTHGTIARDEQGSGFEVSKGTVLPIGKAEIEKLKPTRDHIVDLQCFLPVDKVDISLYSGKSHYLIPDGASGAKPYAVLRRAMEEQDVVGVCEVVMSSKRNLVALRVEGGLLTLTYLHYAQHLKGGDRYREELPDVEPTASELTLAKRLVRSLQKREVDWSSWRDLYADQLDALISEKLKREKPIVTPPSTDEEGKVVDLMAALKASVKKARPRKAGQSSRRRDRRRAKK